MDVVQHEAAILVMAGYQPEAADDLARRNNDPGAVIAPGEAVMLSVLEGSSADVDDRTKAQRIAGVRRLVEAIDRGEIDGGVVAFTRFERPMESWEGRSDEEVSAMFVRAGVSASMAEALGPEREEVRGARAIEPRTLIDTVVVGRDFAVARVSDVDDGTVVHESHHFAAKGTKMTLLSGVAHGAGRISPDDELRAARQTADALESGDASPFMVDDTRQTLAVLLHATSEHRRGTISETVVGAWRDANSDALGRPVSKAAAERAAAVVPPQFEGRLASLLASRGDAPLQTDAMRNDDHGEGVSERKTRGIVSQAASLRPPASKAFQEAKGLESVDHSLLLMSRDAGRC